VRADASLGGASPHPTRPLAHLCPGPFAGRAQPHIWRSRGAGTDREPAGPHAPFREPSGDRRVAHESWLGLGQPCVALTQSRDRVGAAAIGEQLIHVPIGPRRHASEGNDQRCAESHRDKPRSDDYDNRNHYDSLPGSFRVETRTTSTTSTAPTELSLTEPFFAEGTASPAAAGSAKGTEAARGPCKTRLTLPPACSSSRAARLTAASMRSAGARSPRRSLSSLSSSGSPGSKTAAQSGSAAIDLVCNLSRLGCSTSGRALAES